MSNYVCLNQPMRERQRMLNEVNNNFSKDLEVCVHLAKIRYQYEYLKHSKIKW